ncbi:MAG: hypothetical protein ACR2MZ_08675 [Candidatus Dormibacter sp.]|uniref:hypothetical protein n=1 Tax=Candidatus Dormibacter sp. TaxID=2973982 RepID=UPI003D9BE2A6
MTASVRRLRALAAWLMVLAAVTATSCGSPSRMTGSQNSAPSSQPYVPPGAPTPDPNGPPFLTVVLRPGEDPTAVGHRIAGAAASVSQAPQTPQENLPAAIRRRTYRIGLLKGQGVEALRRAQTDPGVMRAYLGEYPGQYPEQ